MPYTGKFNSLPVVRKAEQGLYLDGKELGEILLPRRYVPEGAKPGDELEVFLYYDSEDRLIATTETPLAQAGEFALLKVAAITKHGAFMDWGLPKDLFVPFREQHPPMEEGKSYLVHVYTDGDNGRLLASSRIDRFLNLEPGKFEQGQEVEALVAKNTELGYKCVVNNTHSGILYHNEVFSSLKVGQVLKAYVSNVRDDGRLDLLLQKPGYEKVGDLRDQLLAEIRKRDGFLPLTDKSPAEEVYKIFGVSKKTFKKTVGMLYKDRLVVLDDKGIWLVK